MGEREAGDWLEQADFFILGVLSLLAAFFLACWLRFGDLAVLGSPLYRNLTAVLAVVELLVSAAFGEPGREWRSGRGGKAAGVVRHVLFVELLSVAWLFFTKEAEAYSRAVCLMTGVFSALFRPAVWHGAVCGGVFSGGRRFHSFLSVQKRRCPAFLRR